MDVIELWTPAFAGLTTGESREPGVCPGPDPVHTGVTAFLIFYESIKKRYVLDLENPCTVECLRRTAASHLHRSPKVKAGKKRLCDLPAIRDEWEEFFIVERID